MFPEERRAHPDWHGLVKVPGANHHIPVGGER
jgi:hypothetical protein